MLSADDPAAREVISCVLHCTPQEIARWAYVPAYDMLDVTLTSGGWTYVPAYDMLDVTLTSGDTYRVSAFDYMKERAKLGLPQQNEG